MNLISWTHFLLLCVCCHHLIWPAGCKPPRISTKFLCDVTDLNSSFVKFDCQGRRLSEIPHGITSNVTELNLSRNNIQDIKADSFSKFKNLTILRLDRNCIKTIDKNTFKNLTKLTELTLNENNLTGVPVNLSNSLEILMINKNRIGLLNNKSFGGLKNLTKLCFSRNCFFPDGCLRSLIIKEYPFAALTKLNLLDLSFDNLSHVPEGLPPSLVTLSLESNHIQYISERYFSGLYNLKTLKINGNCPRCLNAPFPCNSCPMGSLRIHDNAFHDLIKLETLDLGGNSLTHLNSSWFESLGNLRALVLPFNFLQKVISGDAKFLKYLQKLEKADFSFNFLLKEYPKTFNLSDAFSNLRSLKTLHLEGLVFQELRRDTLRPLQNLKNLSVLNLGTNFIIKSDSDIFRNFTHLKVIYLAENRLHPISVKEQRSADGLNQKWDFSISASLKPPSKQMNVQATQAFVKPTCFNSGRVLSLSSNNLFFISSAQFHDYGNISCLNLSQNGFSAALNGTEFSALSDLVYLDLSYNRIDLAHDTAFNELQKLKVLDLSYNPHYFQAYGVTLNLNFLKNLSSLKVLNMSNNFIYTLTTKQMCSQSLAELQFHHNNLGKLWKQDLYMHLFTNLTNLTILDISFNSIAKIPDRVYNLLPRKLKTLHLSHNKLKNFQWEKLKAFHQLEILDLSNNYLTYVTGMNTNATSTVIYLDLSNNHIFHLENGFLKGAKSLGILNLDNNKLAIVNQSTFELEPGNTMETLLLSKNPYQCTCDSLDFILWIEKTDIKIPRLMTEVKCATPENQRGLLLIEFDITQCVNDNEAFLLCIFTSSFIFGLMSVATVAHLFYWDASYILLFVKAKLKGYSYLNSSDSVYDVFVTYDTKDPHVSEWVMKTLIGNLEEEGEKGPPLCLEERDWTPGVPMLDNLIHSIRYSRKTMFVLTEGYVKTGVFKMAMYLAHQRLLDENVDVIILLMLEPVLQYSHFLQLRRRLCEKSVVEWPKTAAAEPWFWQNLRNVIRVDNQVMYNKTYQTYFTSK